MTPPSRVALIQALRAALAEDLAALESISAQTRDEVGSDETKSEGKYDTRSTEASYLARGQAWRVAELRRQLAWAQGFDAERPAPEQVQVGSLALLSGEREEWVFLAPFGGTKLEVEGVVVKVISPASPVGRALAELEEGDGVEVDSPRGLLELELSVLA